MTRKILPAITTFTWTNISSWQEKVSEIDRLGLKEVALFITALSFEKRPELYRALEKTKLESIPFVHIKSDVTFEELDYLSERWSTEFFNHHVSTSYPLENDLAKYFSKLYIENTDAPLTDEELVEMAGICLDFAHLEDARRFIPDLYQQWQKALSKYLIGCGHISAVGQVPWFDKKHGGVYRCSKHSFDDLSEFDYLTNFSPVLFPPILAIELENPLSDQLKVKEYVEKILRKT